MGGSGGGGYFSGRTDPQELLKQVREAEAKAVDESFESQVNDLISARLGEINNRDTEGFRAILEKVKSDLQNDLEETVELRFGGSVARHTYVDGLSDIDALVFLKSVTAQTPDELRERFADVLRARFGADSVTVGKLAVTLQIDDKTIQLLPADRTSSGFRIPNPDGTSWSSTDPKKFADRLTAANERMTGKLVPTIKLAKAIIGNFPEQRRLSGYHIESLAIETFKTYTGQKMPKAMLQFFFEGAASHIKQPIKDPTGQSPYVDEYLGPANSLQRRIIADSLDRMGRRFRNADVAKSAQIWQELLDAE